jgi:hypothetical protein
VPSRDNIHYLRTKQEKLGHLFNNLEESQHENSDSSSAV